MAGDLYTPDAGAWTLKGFRVGAPTQENRPVVSTSVSVFDHAGNEIGFIKQINRSHARTNTPIRHLSALDGGRIVSWVLGVENITLDFQGFNLYRKAFTEDGALLNRITGRNALEYGSAGNPFVCLNQQRIPFSVIKREVHPMHPDVGMVTLFGDIVLNNFSDPINIDTVSQVQTARADCAWCHGWFISQESIAGWTDKLTIDGVGV